jgi:DNA-binding CsgD family transcriptional regulator
MSIASGRARAATALAALERLSSAAWPAEQVAEQIVRHTTGVINAGIFFVGAIDPHTGLCLGAAAHNMDPAACGPAWEHEFCIPDYNKFADLTPRNPVGDLREATGGRLSRSPRYRSMNAIADLGDELRATLHAGGLAWGNMILSRHTGDGPFSDDDRAFLAKAAPLAGAALRRAVLQEPQRALPVDGPGIVVVDEAGAVVSATAEAEAWLRALGAGHQDPAMTGIRPELLLMPLIIPGAPDAPPRRARLRTPQGTWLAAHASPLGDAGHTGIVIEPAKAPEVTPIVMEAFGLTSREVQVAELVARAVSTEEIASTLFLSRHTVRGHLKAIFGKTGVSSRGELTSKLFAEHYRGPLADTMNTSVDRVADSAALAREGA